MGFLVSGISLQNSRRGIGLSLSLLLASAGLMACGQKETNSPSAQEQKIGVMMDKMGVPGVSSTPSRTAMALDCPPIKTMLDEVRTAPQSISPASRRALNAWSRWCKLEPLPDQAS